MQVEQTMEKLSSSMWGYSSQHSRGAGENQYPLGSIALPPAEHLSADRIRFGIIMYLWRQMIAQRGRQSERMPSAARRGSRNWRRRGFRLPTAVAVCIAILAVTGYFLTRPAGGGLDQSPIPGLRPGMRAPDFALADLQGQTFRLNALHGHWVLLNFWGVTCPPCKEEMPALERAYSASQSTADAMHRPVVLGVDGDLDSTQSIRSLVARLGVHYPILQDTSLSVMSRYHIGQLPASVLIDPNGVVEAVHVGPLDASEIEHELQGKLGKNRFRQI